MSEVTPHGLEIRVAVQRVREQVQMPTYQSLGSAGADLRACIVEPLGVRSLERVLVPTGLVFEIPEGYEGQLRSRSGLAYQKGLVLANSPGTIDSDYRGEVQLLVVNLSATEQWIEPQMRLAQIVFAPCVRACFATGRELSLTDRGSGAFGSTGVR